MASSLRFPIRFDSSFGFLARILFMRPSESFVEVEGSSVRAQMAWSFATRFPRSAIQSAEAYERRPLSRGVHGLSGRWLVNGSGEGIVSIRLHPPQRASVLGFPVRLTNLLVSVVDAEGLLAALRP